MSALHQSSNERSVRANGSIVATDIKNYLTSRHGIIVTEEDVKLNMLNGLLSSSYVPSNSSNNDSDHNSNSENDNNNDNKQEETHLDMSEIASMHGSMCE